MVLPNWASMKRTGVDCAAMAISGKEFGKGGVEVVGDEGGDNVLFAIGDDKEMMGANGVKVVLPSRARENARLRTSRARSAFFSFCIHSLGF